MAITMTCFSLTRVSASWWASSAKAWTACCLLNPPLVGPPTCRSCPLRWWLCPCRPTRTWGGRLRTFSRKSTNSAEPRTRESEGSLWRWQYNSNNIYNGIRNVSNWVLMFWYEQLCEWWGILESIIKLITTNALYDIAEWENSALRTYSRFIFLLMLVHNNGVRTNLIKTRHTLYLLIV